MTPTTTTTTQDLESWDTGVFVQGVNASETAEVWAPQLGRADAGAVANGMEAVVSGDRVFIQSQGAGSTESFQLIGGSGAAGGERGGGANHREA